MIRLTHALLPVLFVAVVLGVPLPLADAASTQYLITGELESPAPTTIERNLRNPRGTETASSGGSFAFRLNFDEPAVPDFGLLGGSSDDEPYAADSWSLDIFGATGLVGSYSQDTDPDFLGFTNLRGELTGFDSGETFIDLGVDTNPEPGRVLPEETLIDLDFYTDELVSAFFIDNLAAIPSDTEFRGGTILDLDTGERVTVANAVLVATSIDEAVFVENGDDGETSGLGNTPGSSGTVGGDPSAVPTPGAAVGGLLLMLLLILRQLNRTQTHIESA